MLYIFTIELSESLRNSVNAIRILQCKHITIERNHFDTCKWSLSLFDAKYFVIAMVNLFNSLFSFHFTGDPRTPQSLHFNSQYQPSQYVQALQAVGGVIEDYDTYVPPVEFLDKSIHL